MVITTRAPCRLADGGGVDRSRRLRFKFNGQEFVGFEGDTLASALLGAGVLFVGRSIRRRRPRGLFAIGAADPSSLVTIGEGRTQDPVALATQVRLYDGLTARSVRGWPSLRWDSGACLDLPYVRHLTAAGFYYKTFFWPRWEYFEPLIRRAAGPAAISLIRPDVDAEQEFASANAIVIGGGPAGITAALELADVGQSVILIEEESQLGGSAQWSGEPMEDLPGLEWIARQESLVRSNPRITVLRNTLAFGCYDHGTVGAIEYVADANGRLPPGRRRLRLWKIRAPQIVLAAGALERPVLFAHNDRPGILLASAAHEYLGRFGVQVSRRPVIVTNNDTAYSVATALAVHCREPVTILDCRAGLRAVAETLPSNVEVITEATVTASLETRSLKQISHRFGAVTEVEFTTCTGQHKLPCDALIVSGGWSPSIQLASHTSKRPVYDASLDILKTPPATREFYAVGSAAGEWGHDAAVASTRLSVRAFNGSVSIVAARHQVHNWPVAANYPRTPKDREPDVWVDLQNDVSLRDLRIACDHGFHSIEHIKRFTTLGMGTDQGRTSAVNAMHAVGSMLGRSAEEIGVTTHRPPLAPVSLAALAGAGRGRLFVPRRKLPALTPQVRLQAVFDDFGGWERADFYAVNGPDRESAVECECRAVRHGVGLFDGSPIGKIEVGGPDAGRFLDRFYINNIVSLSQGRVRYGLMLNDYGTILDDGVIARRGPENFVISPTSSNARRIYAWLDRWHQIEWPEERVAVIDVTEQWAVLTLVGPKAAKVFLNLRLCQTLRAADSRHMSYAEGFIHDIRCRIWRVSFTGELQFEIHVPSDRAEWLWTELSTAGAEWDIRPIGLEAWTRLRIDKGYIHLGAETDGRTSADDLGYGDIARAKTRQFIGQRSLGRADSRRPDRLQLVGLLSENPHLAIPEGTHLLADPQINVGSRAKLSAVSAGHVTSSCMSVAMGRSIALALLQNGRSRIGKWVTTFSLGAHSRAKVVAPMFYDPLGERLHG